MTDTTEPDAPEKVFADATQMMGSSDEVMIEVDGVDKFFGDFQALTNINMRVGKQEVVVVIGPSGSGKSTLIRCINRLEKHDRGRGELLRQRASLEDRLGGDRNIVLQIGHPVTARKNRETVLGHADGAAR